MIGLLTAFDKIDAVFTINDQEAIGADLAASSSTARISSSRRSMAPPISWKR